MFCKLFKSLYEGSLRGQADAILVFTNLLAHADRDGVVDKHPRAIADEVGISVERVRKALDDLEQPDPDSRTPDQEGRRIVRLDDHRNWGWSIVNYAKYRAIRSEEDRRDQNREAQQRHRYKSQPPSAAVSRRNPEKAQAEAEAEAEGEVEAADVAVAVGSTASTGKKIEKRSGAVAKNAPSPAAVEAARATWAAYSKAYGSRYGAEPVRNAKVNTLISQLVKRLGAEAPEVASSYISHPDAVYARANHCLDLLVRDAEKLRTEWFTGRRVTSTTARQADRTASNGFLTLLQKEGRV